MIKFLIIRNCVLNEFWTKFLPESLWWSLCLNSDWGRVIESWIIWGKFLKYKAAEQRSLSLSCALCWYWYCVSILLSISISHLNKDSEDGTHPSSLNSWACYHQQINDPPGKLNLWWKYNTSRTLYHQPQHWGSPNEWGYFCTFKFLHEMKTTVTTKEEQSKNP